MLLVPSLLAALTLGAVDPRSAAPGPHLAAVHTSRPPLIDGRLDDPPGRTPRPTDAFTQQSPFDGAKPSERTQMRVLYDDDAIYIGFDCEQVNTPIVERLTRRDRDSESEWVWILIDSRNEGKSAFMFAVNISGTIADGQIIDQTTYSWEWDENWEGKTAASRRRLVGGDPHPDPRAPLRRQPARPELGLPGGAVHRRSARRRTCGRTSRATSRRRSRYLGRLDDLRGLKGGGALELLRSASATRAAATRSRHDAGQRLQAGRLGGARISSGTSRNDVTLDAAFNPDFAQVEADQVILNLTNFETFLPEKRPFFLEGIDAFSFPLQVFYSRRIGARRPRRRWADGEQLVDVPLACDDLRRGQARRAAGAALDAGRAERPHRREPGHRRTTRSDGVVEPMLAAPTTAFNVLRLKRELGQRRRTSALDRNGRPARFDDANAPFATPTSAASTAAGARRRPTTS